MSRKVLFITPIFPSSENDDTIVPFIYQFTDQFSKKYPEIEIHVLAINYPSEKSTYQINTISVFCAKGKFKKGMYSLMRFLKALTIAFKLCRKNRYAAVLSFWYGSSTLIGKVLKLMFQCKHIIWMQGQDVKSNNPYLRLFPSTGENIIVMGKNHQQLLAKNHHIETKNIAHVAINEHSFPELKTTGRTIDIIGVGNLVAIKNYSRFIDVIFEIHKIKKNLKVVLCGDGEEKELLKEKASRLHLTEVIHFTGYIPNQMVKKLLNDAKVFLHTSTFEGNPMVIQEALYSGCNIVSSFNIQERQQSIKNFYFAENQQNITSKIIQLLSSDETDRYSRVHHFKIEDTLRTVHDLLLDNSSNTP